MSRESLRTVKRWGECVKNGIALGRVLYLGHGTRAMRSDKCVFENAEEMQSNGFEPSMTFCNYIPQCRVSCQPLLVHASQHGDR